MGFDLSRKRAQHEFEFYTIHYTIQGILNGHFMYPCRGCSLVVLRDRKGDVIYTIKCIALASLLGT